MIKGYLGCFKEVLYGSETTLRANKIVSNSLTIEACIKNCGFNMYAALGSGYVSVYSSLNKFFILKKYN